MPHEFKMKALQYTAIDIGAEFPEPLRYPISVMHPREHAIIPPEGGVIVSLELEGGERIALAFEAPTFNFTVIEWMKIAQKLSDLGKGGAPLSVDSFLTKDVVAEPFPNSDDIVLRFNKLSGETATTLSQASAKALYDSLGKLILGQ